MSEYITSKEMLVAEINSEYLGVPRLELMENAGRAIADAIRKRYDRGTITIVAGRGNNGGDAFVAARYLKGFDLNIVLLGSSEDIRTEEAKINWDGLKDTDATLTKVHDIGDIDRGIVINSDIIIDAIFGTGIHGSIGEPEASVIDLINESNAFVISVDVPSGMDPDTGKGIKMVHPDLTITFHKMKKGLATMPNVEVVDIGVPEEGELFVGPGDVHSLVSRDSDSHKGDNGRILIIGGGAYSGAPALTAMASLRAGADIATIATPASVSDVIASFSPNLIVSSLTSDVLTPDDLPIITELVQEHDVVVIGMGLGRGELTLRAIKAIIPICKKVVIDADALSALDLPLDGAPDGTSGGVVIPTEFQHNAIITPHAGEFKRLVGCDIPKDWKKRTALVKKFAKENNVVVLLKGKMDIISDGASIKMNKTGNVGMTVGGTGDVLAGIVGALYAKNNASESAAAASFINGLAGDIAFEEYGFGLLATDVIDNIPKAIKKAKDEL